MITNNQEYSPIRAALGRQKREVHMKIDPVPEGLDGGDLIREMKGMLWRCVFGNPGYGFDSPLYAFGLVASRRDQDKCQGCAQFWRSGQAA